MNRTFFSQFASLLLLSSLAVPLAAQPTLSGVTLYQTNTSGANKVPNRESEFRGAWRTDQAAIGYSGLYLTKNAASPFTWLNSGSADLTPVSLDLGVNRFYFRSSGFDALANQDGFGLNVWLNNDPTTCTPSPSFSVFRDFGSANFAPNTSATTATQCPIANNWITGAGNSVVTSGLFTVALTDFFVEKGVADEVASTSTVRDLALDNAGYFDLTVRSVDTPPITAIPEPSTYVLMAAGLAGMAVVTRRRRRS